MNLGLVIQKIIRPTPILLVALAAPELFAQPAVTEPSVAEDDTRITYPASFFIQYEPNSVNDMLNRIPGISLALNGGGNDGNNRGLGGGDQILIDGKRIAGKENEASSQLSRIAADQVQYIEIIRGTSTDLDVRNAGQIINIVLIESPSRSSVAAEVNVDRYQDGTLQPGGSVALSGQRGALTYLISAAAEPRYEFRDRDEYSINGDFSPNERIHQEDTREQTSYNYTGNFTYAISAADTLQFNALYGEHNPPTEIERVITNLNVNPAVSVYERETVPGEAENWEIGGNYEHRFANDSRFRILFISNEDNSNSTRERFVSNSLGGSETKDLFLSSDSTSQERIVRSSYNWNVTGNQGMEIGVERAQTILNTALAIGALGTGTPSPALGGLVPVPVSNARSEVEEMRYEAFAVHNWQINSRMSLESSLIMEFSEITQHADTNVERDFEFARPKLDYRFDITPSLQARMTVEKFVSQLSFSDFSATANSGDNERDSLAGNPDLVQEQSWRYEANLEYRLPGDTGVLNSRIFYYDLQDVIDRVDVSLPDGALVSAPGNIGDGKRYGIALDASTRLGFIGLPDALVTAGVKLEDSEVTDPFLGMERRIGGQNYGRGNLTLGFRHDIQALSFNYGFNYSYGINDNRKLWDIDLTESYNSEPSLTVFLEKIAFGGITFRTEAMNTLDGDRCRIRTRFVGHIRDGIIDEIEDSCSGTGIKLALKIRGTF